MSFWEQNNVLILSIAGVVASYVAMERTGILAAWESLFARIAGRKES